MSRTIPLKGGFVACVDEADYDWLSAYDWRVLGTRWKYAVTYIPTMVGKSGRPRPVHMHRLIMNVVEAGRSVYVDHTNGDGLDNRRENLRITDNKGNQGNRHAKHLGTSCYRGVVESRGGWMARIRVDRKLKYIGTFDTEEDAALGYDVAARLHFGEFANLNLPARIGDHAEFFLTRFVVHPHGTRVYRKSGMPYGSGVSPRGDKWRAIAYENGRQKHIGYFPTMEEAIAARNDYLKIRR